MGYLRQYFRERRWILVLLALWTALFAAVFFLYRLPVEAAGYGALLCLTALAVWGAVDFLVWRRRVRLLEEMEGRAALLIGDLPESGGRETALYQSLLRELDGDRRQLATAEAALRRETVDYYTLWVHQIKSPIAAMGLMLQDDETDRGRELKTELFRIERYVELVLGYLRLGSESTDYTIRSYPLLPILRRAARKYAPLFIRGKVSLDLEETELSVITDEKWLQLVVEQILSNAVKYAPGGHVRVSVRGESLVIQDDGVGISPEDLPRIFEKGFTGCNGRLEGRSTGIGLYICRRICRRLGHTITVDSEPGRGTRVTVGLARPLLEVE